MECRRKHTTETHRETTMHHLMMNLPVAGPLGVAALLAGPLARLPIDLGTGPIPKSGRSWHLWQSEKARFSSL